MSYIKILSTLLAMLLTPSLWASDNSYSSYNDIVSDLHNQLRTKTEDTIVKLKDGSYSLAVGLNTQVHSIYDESILGLGIGAELGVYNLTPVPVKFALLYAKGDNTSEFTGLVKTDHSIYKYNLFNVKVGLAAGLAVFDNDNFDFNSIFLSPSLAGFYQVNKMFDVSLNLEYLFHSSSKISNHFNPSVNLVTYF